MDNVAKGLAEECSAKQILDQQALFDLEFLKSIDDSLGRTNSTTGHFVVPRAQDAFAGWSEALQFLEKFEYLILFDSEIDRLFKSVYLGGNVHLAAKAVGVDSYTHPSIEHAWLGWKAAFSYVTRQREAAVRS